MPKGSHYGIVFAEESWRQLGSIERKYHSLIVDTIEQQLSFEPELETRNRKPLAEPSVFGVAWELRFGRPDNRFRVFYRVDREAYEVRVLAILVKRNNKLYVGNEEFDL